MKPRSKRALAIVCGLVALGIALGSLGILAPAHAAIPWQQQTATGAEGSAG